MKPFSSNRTARIVQPHTVKRSFIGCHSRHLVLASGSERC